MFIELEAKLTDYKTKEIKYQKIYVSKCKLKGAQALIPDGDATQLSFSVNDNFVINMPTIKLKELIEAL